MKRKVLLVDDSMFLRRILTQMLESLDCEIVGEASNGLEGVQKYLELRPDVVFMDITMNELDGLGALTQIIQADPTAKVVMCSAMGQQCMVLDAIQHGAKDFVVKPFQRDRLANALNKIFS